MCKVSSPHDEDDVKTGFRYKHEGAFIAKNILLGL